MTLEAGNEAGGGHQLNLRTLAVTAVTGSAVVRIDPQTLEFKPVSSENATRGK